MKTSTFIIKSNNIHGNSFSYENTDYVNINEEVCVTCKCHGNFYIKPKDHLKGKGCPKDSFSKV
jgi:hypothetical protein